MTHIINKKGVIKMEEGKCPKCGNYNLDYEALEIEGNSIYYPWTCPDCGASGKEWYDLTFSEQELECDEEKGGD